MSKDEVFQPWLRDRDIVDVEAFVPDIAGSPRGKVLPADKIGVEDIKMSEAVFSQTVSGVYIKDKNNLEDRDMWLIPDAATLRPVPWAADPAASVFLDCYRRDGSQLSKSPRTVAALAYYFACRGCVYLRGRRKTFARWHVGPVVRERRLRSPGAHRRGYPAPARVAVLQQFYSVLASARN